MLDAVGFGFAVNPDRAMKRAAAEHGWGVLGFQKPVALREAGRRRNAAAVGVVLAVAAVLLWAGKRRRDRRRRAI